MTEHPITILGPSDDYAPPPGPKRSRPSRWSRIKAAWMALLLAAVLVGFLIAAVVLGSILATVILIVAAVAIVFATIQYGSRRILHK
jgi:phosphatidylglycerophosphate synthase